MGAGRLLVRVLERATGSSAASITRSCAAWRSQPRDGTKIPHLLFFAFQATFCIVTTALVAGAVVERMRFGPFLIFAALWSVLVYGVLAHWAFGGGWLQAQGTLDFAGGIPVEMGSGFSALAAALVVGARTRLRAPGASCRTTRCSCCSAPGCCGSAGSASTAAAAFGAGNAGVLAFVNTLLTPACALATWFVLDLLRSRQVTAIGAATAIVVGCVGITPAAGFISPIWAMVLGVVAALPSYAVIMLRPRSRVDETLDVLAAHGVAGLTGHPLHRARRPGVLERRGRRRALRRRCAQLGEQLVAVLAAPAYAFAATFVLLKLIALVMPLRATAREEALGMDIVAHGEEAYATGEGAILVDLPEPKPRKERELVEA